MKIRILDFVEGARNATGIVVIIDVFRAFSVACYAFDRGAARIIPVAEIDEALAWRARDPSVLLIGEREGKPLEGFDFGNSPTEISKADLAGRTLVHTTHAGTQGVHNAVQARRVLAGSLVNAAATARYIRELQPDEVSLVRMGHEASRRTDEDDVCAAYLEALLLGQSFDAKAIPSMLAASPCAQRFFDPAIPWNPESDFWLCVNVDRFPFAVELNGVYFSRSTCVDPTESV